jgi:hypothetical protein
LLMRDHEDHTMGSLSPEGKLLKHPCDAKFVDIY